MSLQSTQKLVRATSGCGRRSATPAATSILTRWMWTWHSDVGTRRRASGDIVHGMWAASMSSIGTMPGQGKQTMRGTSATSLAGPRRLCSNFSSMRLRYFSLDGVSGFISRCPRSGESRIVRSSQVISGPAIGGALKGSAAKAATSSDSISATASSLLLICSRHARSLARASDPVVLAFSASTFSAESDGRNCSPRGSSLSSGSRSGGSPSSLTPPQKHVRHPRRRMPVLRSRGSSTQRRKATSPFWSPQARVFRGCDKDPSSASATTSVSREGTCTRRTALTEGRTRPCRALAVSRKPPVAPMGGASCWEVPGDHSSGSPVRFRKGK
mmetsp:Transcript_52349/g.114507  ORF Transcript_52349/g.114507 Transcript_52349/m.114507 type:complete len:328 (-) Transcript_52349:178-1161(-)